MARRPAVSIVGCGRAGGALALALARNGYTVPAAWSRSRAGRQRAHRLLDVPVLSQVAEVAAAGDVVIVAVPDDAIADVAADVAGGVRAGRLAVHTGGGTSVEALAPVREAGGRIGSFHPLQTIPDAVRGAEALRGAGFAVTCQAADRPVLNRMARAVGGRPFVLEDEAKAVYHAAAVFASNYVVTSVWAATNLLEKVGIGNARHLLGPLVRASADNAASTPGARALTGPVARGDAETVRRHMQALRRDDPTPGHIAEAYGSLARLAAALVGGDAGPFEGATA